jgi:monofunctional biosynthetic peptidoglycan transglycosylase
MSRVPLLRQVLRVAAALLAFGFGYLAYVYLTLPDVRALRDHNPETTAFIELRAREAEAAGTRARRIQYWVPYGRISANLKRAVLVAEDAGFWEHEGVDFEALRESLETNWRRFGFVRGGSTITQQLAKNLFLSPSKNPLRKLREFFIARRLEAELSKRRILELYLNVIEWGDGVYGADAAARTHLGRSAGDLLPEEAALLAAAIVNPRVFDPARPSPSLRARQRLILRRMGSVTPPPSAPDPVPIPPMPLPVTPFDPSILPGQTKIPK